MRSRRSRLALDRDAHEVGGLVVQTIGHVEIGFGQRIALVEVDRGLAADGLVGAHRRRAAECPASPAARDACRIPRRGCRRARQRPICGARMRPVSESESSRHRPGGLRPCSARRPRLSSNSANLRLPRDLTNSSAEQQHHDANQYPPVFENRVEQSTVLPRSIRLRCALASPRRVVSAGAAAGSGVGSTASGVAAAGAAASGCAGVSASGVAAGVSTGAGVGAGCAAGVCCCEAASLACRSASSVLRSSSMRFDSLSWPSSSRTRPCSCETAAEFSLPEPALAADSLGGTRRRRPAPLMSGGARIGADAAADFVARFGRRNRGDFFAAGMRSTEPARKRFMSPSNAPELPR